MQTTLITKYQQAILGYRGNCQDSSLLLQQEGPLVAYYAPVEYVNPAAKLVIVGITPGATQASNALAEAQRQLRAGADFATTLREAKRFAAFSGPMRPNLVDLLDHIGINGWLRVSSCESLFEVNHHLVQTSSIFTYPVFLNGENYNSKPDPIRTALLRDQFLRYFVPMAEQLPDAVYVPLGPLVTKVLIWASREGHLRNARVLVGLPHPSPSNVERIQYFLRRKAREKLSIKTDPVKLDGARASLLAQVAAL